MDVGHTLILDDGKLRLTCTGTDKDAHRHQGEGRRQAVEPQRRQPARHNSSPAARSPRKIAAISNAAFEAEADWIALSFIQQPEDVAEVRKMARGRSGILSKIEKPQAVEKIEEIIELSDAIMVARGDLGVEMPLRRCRAHKKRITRAARKAGKPVVVATQMLDP